MTQMIKLAKVTAIPATLAANTLYLLKDANDKLSISLTDNTGSNAISLDTGDLSLKADLVNGKIPVSQIADSILGKLEYQGTIDLAAATLPAAATANKGWYYIATNAVETNGYTSGDWAVSNGVSWDKIDNTEAVQTVAGRTGAVVLSTADLTDFATAVTTPLSLKAPLASPTLTTPIFVGSRETRVALAANAIDLAVANYFSKTIAANTTFTVTNTPTTGVTGSFILDLTNGGAFTITWWANVKWASGVAPALTAAGRDILAFFTYDGGTIWNGLVVSKDLK